MTDVNPNTQPVVPQNGNIPAGWVSTAEHERQSRMLIAQEFISEGRRFATHADEEAAIDARIAERRRGAPVTPKVTTPGE